MNMNFFIDRKIVRIKEMKKFLVLPRYYLKLFPYWKYFKKNLNQTNKMTHLKEINSL